MSTPGLQRILQTFLVLVGVVSCTREFDPGRADLNLVRFREHIDSAVRANADGREHDAVRFLALAFDDTPRSVSTELRHAYYAALTTAAMGLGAHATAVDAVAAMVREAEPTGSRTEQDATLWMAHVLTKVGDTSLAIVWFRRAEIMSPRALLPSINTDMASLFVSARQYDSALVRLARADSLTTLGIDIQLYDRIWGHLIRARCEAGLRRFEESKQHLLDAVRALEQPNAEHQYYGPSARRALLQGIWRDSVLFRPLGAAWDGVSARLHAMERVDSVLLRSPGRIDSNSDEQAIARLRALIPLRGDDLYHRIPSLDDGPFITDTVIDRRGSQWVSTLSGVYLRLGAKLLPVLDPTMHGHLHAARSVRIERGTMRIGRYDGTSDTVRMDTLVLVASKATETATGLDITWNFRHWNAKPPTAIVMHSNSDRTLYVYGNTFGVGTTEHEPQQVRTLRVMNGAPWNGRVRCGEFTCDSIVVVGTSAGLWSLNINTGIVRGFGVEPAELNDLSIQSVQLLGHRGLLVTPADGDPYLFELVRDEDVSYFRQTGRRITSLIPTIWKPTPQLRFAFDLQHGASGSQVGALPVRSGGVPPNQHAGNVSACTRIATDSVIAWMFQQEIVLHDLTRPATSIHRMPPHAHLPQGGGCYSVRDGALTIGMADPNGLLLGTLTRRSLEIGSRMVALRVLSRRNYTISAQGAQIVLDASDRDLAVMIGRPITYGTIRVPIQLSPSWTDEVITSTTNEEVTFLDIPAGTHTIEVRGDDQPDPLIIRVEAMPGVTETWWFIGGVIAIIILLGTGSVRYLIVRRSYVRDAVYQAALEERVQIGRDLHDVIGADLVRINNLARSSTFPTATEITRLTREASRSLRDIIWSVTDPPTLDAAVAVIAERARSSATEVGIEAVIELPTNIPMIKMDPQRIRDIVLIATEAVTNVTKHSAAKKMQFIVISTPDGTTLSIIDDGVGFDIASHRQGIGLQSMHQRALRSGLDLVVSSSPAGTTIRIHIPHPNS